MSEVEVLTHADQSGIKSAAQNLGDELRSRLLRPLRIEMHHIDDVDITVFE